MGACHATYFHAMRPKLPLAGTAFLRNVPACVWQRNVIRFHFQRFSILLSWSNNANRMAATSNIYPKVVQTWGHSGAKSNQLETFCEPVYKVWGLVGKLSGAQGPSGSFQQVVELILSAQGRGCAT